MNPRNPNRHCMWITSKLGVMPVLYCRGLITYRMERDDDNLRRASALADADNMRMECTDV